MARVKAVEVEPTGNAPFLLGTKHDAALVLFQLRWTDPQIAGVFDLHPQTIKKWRRRHGLVSLNRMDKFDDGRALRLYREGATDGEIARALGGTQSGATRWRQRNGLAPHIEFGAGRMTQKRRAAAERMLRRNLTIREVARELDVSRNTIQRVRSAMKNRRGLRPTGVRTSKPKQITTEPITVSAATQIQFERRIVAAVGFRVAPDIAADAIGDMWVAILAGKLDPANIEIEARAYVNRVLGRFASQYGPASLDEELGDEPGWTLGHILEDPNASTGFDLALYRGLYEDGNA